ncbi:hypothetical protein [Marinobacter nauticus]|uniref:Uncharacterized protein n=1 Tax=Marinobacter nauticus TaxID=2743 RepID=A0A1M2UWW0_MARNT|nr:hypothetical protein [Marinobacter nauticus]OJS99828.1 hypothetical protein BEE62_06835 [Marinobacter nauticus]
MNASFDNLEKTVIIRAADHYALLLAERPGKRPWGPIWPRWQSDMPSGKLRPITRRIQHPGAIPLRPPT